MDFESAGLVATAPARTAPGGLLMDLGSVFASLILVDLIVVSSHIGATPWLLGCVILISLMASIVCFDGVAHGRFAATCGFRQGCTGATALFGCALDLVPRWMSARSGPNTLVRAYVDDRAFVLRDL